ncbi:MAG: ATP-binding protein [Candidatus Aminicenantes bacterium]|nr:ATP-binding protein [Candidatus Aminicenantes bacterium]
MALLEKLGVFYLGREYDLAHRKTKDDLVLYDAKDLVTHAVCVGMTGSGKTGLCLSLLEEAAIDRIPAILIDPKGDLGNLFLTFPGLSAEDFRPWVDPDEAARKGMSVEEFAAQQADLWRNGLKEWGMDGSRIALLRESADFSIFTPGSSAGLPVSVLRSFAAPPASLLQDEDFRRDRVSATVSGLLGLLGIEADPLQSREHILVSNILDQSWIDGRDLDLASLIGLIQSPPMKKVGVFDLESFFPSAERKKLALRLNSLLAAPGFQSWLEGEAMDIGALLHSPAGRPRLNIFSIAHLSEAERMFFVTLLLNEVLSWVRTQPGTTSLRAILYMDEIFGFFPPVREPSSKRPLLTLLKQARAYGLGVVLATQNPVDLDYKGLANAGTWFIGRLQTENDKNRLLEGLAGVGQGLDLKKLSAQISGLGKRVFLMHNVHEQGPTIFQTRWALSYLRGPLTRNQIKTLADPLRGRTLSAAEEKKPSPAAAGTAPEEGREETSIVPLPPSGVEQLFLPVRRRIPSVAGLVYRPFAASWAQVSVVDNKLGLSRRESVGHSLELREDMIGLLWDESSSLEADPEDAVAEPESEGRFLPVPEKMSGRLKDAGGDYKDFLARTFHWTLWKSPSLKMTSQPDETERDFRLRLEARTREVRDEELAKLRKKYAARIASLEKQMMTARHRVQREEEQYKGQAAQTAISMGATILGAIFGRRGGTVGRATTAARSASRAYYGKQGVQRAREKAEAAKERIAAIENSLEREANTLARKFDPMGENLEEIVVRPKKADIDVRWSGLLWIPFWKKEEGSREPAF